MESLAEEPWDVVICGTGLQQSLLALALSRSKKRVLHLDPNEYYGGYEAAFSLQEAESFAAARSLSSGSGGGGDGDGDGGTDKDVVFQHASVWKHEDAASLGLSFPRAYSLALAPQIIHSRSKLLEQLVSSRAFRQVEFLAVGPFFVYDDGAGEAADADADASGSPTPKLSRIPSSREDVFSARSIPARSKRSLMKFLRFVTTSGDETAGAGEGEDSTAAAARGRAEQPLVDFLRDEFGLDDALRRYVLALTLSLDPDVSVADGLAAVRRHLASMGFFGPGFCAVYPKWGGLSEVAQVACRAHAVGGGVYMLGTGMEVEGNANNDDDNGRVAVKLSNDITIQTSTIVTSRQEPASDGRAISRLVAVVNSPLQSLFEVTVEGAPTPAVAVVAFPPGSVTVGDDEDLPAPTSPIYALVHSSDTGECPKGQSVVYLTTPTSTTSTPSPRAPDPESAQRLLDRALASLLRAVPAADSSAGAAPTALYKLRYVQTLHNNNNNNTSSTTPTDAREFSFPASSASASPSHPLGVLAFDDTSLDAVRAAWELVTRKTAKKKEEDAPKGGDGEGKKEGGDGDQDGGEASSGKEPQGDGDGDEEENEYMVFRDREGVGDDGNGDGYGDDVYD